MRGWASICVSSVLTVVVPAQPLQRGGRRVAAIEFFGYKGVETAIIRAALPFHEGDEVSDRDTAKEEVREAVVRSIGRKATDVAGICCASDGGVLLFIGIPGGSYKPFAYGPAPTGRANVSNELEQLCQQAHRCAQLPMVSRVWRAARPFRACVLAAVSASVHRCRDQCDDPILAAGRSISRARRLTERCN